MSFDYTFNEDNVLKNVGIGTNNKIIVMNVSNSNNLSLHSTVNDNNPDIISIKNILNKDTNKDLNLSAYDGTSINPIIQINNTHQHINITSNLNVASNLNVEYIKLNKKYTQNKPYLELGGINTTSNTNFKDKEYDVLKIHSPYYSRPGAEYAWRLSTEDINTDSIQRLSFKYNTNLNKGVGGNLVNPLTLTNQGNVGIGTDYPTNKLQVNDGNTLLDDLTTVGDVHLQNLATVSGYEKGLFFHTKTINSSTHNWKIDIGGGTDPGDFHFKYSTNDTFTSSNIKGFIDTSPTNTNVTKMNFTGQHRCVPNKIDFYNNVNDYIGLIVYSIGKYKTYNSSEEKLTIDKEAITINDSLPVIDLSNKKKQKSVFGVISNKEEENRVYSAGKFCTPYPNTNDDKRLYINSLGEGAIWIVNTNGNLENGDYIQSSDVIGMGEKQDDDLLHSYTVAKITCECDFILNSKYYNCIEFVDSNSGNTYRKAFVGCTYHCG